MSAAAGVCGACGLVRRGQAKLVVPLQRAAGSGLAVHYARRLAGKAGQPVSAGTGVQNNRSRRPVQKGAPTAAGSSATLKFRAVAPSRADSHSTRGINPPTWRIPSIRADPRRESLCRRTSDSLEAVASLGRS